MSIAVGAVVVSDMAVAAVLVCSGMAVVAVTLDGSRTLRGSDSERQGHGTAVCGETRTTNNERTMIYCKDSVTPAGPLALCHARIHYSSGGAVGGCVHCGGMCVGCGGVCKQGGGVRTRCHITVEQGDGGLRQCMHRYQQSLFPSALPVSFCTLSLHTLT